jgi:hypothetical protein
MFLGRGGFSIRLGQEQEAASSTALKSTATGVPSAARAWRDFFDADPGKGHVDPAIFPAGMKMDIRLVGDSVVLD